MSLRNSSLFGLVGLLCMLLGGCGGGTSGGGNSTASTSVSISGTVNGGTNGISGSTVTLWAENPSSGTSVSVKSTTTSSDGTFAISAPVIPGSFLYLVASGGSVSTFGVNPNIFLISTLGTTGSTLPNSVVVNEYTTTIVAYTFLTNKTTFLNGSPVLGGSISSLQSNQNTVNSYLDITTGTLNSSLPKSSIEEITSIANILASCVEDSVNGFPTCHTLENASIPSDKSSVPSNILMSLANIASNPANVTDPSAILPLASTPTSLSNTSSLSSLPGSLPPTTGTSSGGSLSSSGGSSSGGSPSSSGGSSSTGGNTSSPGQTGGSGSGGSSMIPVISGVYGTSANTQTTSSSTTPSTDIVTLYLFNDGTVQLSDLTAGIVCSIGGNWSVGQTTGQSTSLTGNLANCAGPAGPLSNMPFVGSFLSSAAVQSTITGTYTNGSTNVPFKLIQLPQSSLPSSENPFTASTPSTFNATVCPQNLPGVITQSLSISLPGNISVSASCGGGGEIAIANGFIIPGTTTVYYYYPPPGLPIPPNPPCYPQLVIEFSSSLANETTVNAKINNVYALTESPQFQLSYMYELKQNGTQPPCPPTIADSLGGVLSFNGTLSIQPTSGGNTHLILTGTLSGKVNVKEETIGQNINTTVTIPAKLFSIPLDMGFDKS